MPDDQEEFNAPVDIIGISTGGSVALHFAALHPSLVRRLVIHSSAHTLNDRAKQLQLDVARAAENGNWEKPGDYSLEPALPPRLQNR